MSGNSALFDSNIIIYLSKREIPLTFLDQFDEHYISFITYMEVLGYRFQDAKEEEFIREMLGVFHILFIDQKIADMVIQIRSEARIRLPDAIIAATTKTANLHLVTRNTEDFKKEKFRLPILLIKFHLILLSLTARSKSVPEKCHGVKSYD